MKTFNQKDTPGLPKMKRTEDAEKDEVSEIVFSIAIVFCFVCVLFC